MADKTLAQKQEAAKKPTEDKVAADKALADAMTAAQKAKDDKPVADKAAADATAAEEVARKARDAAKQAVTEAEAVVKKANDEKAGVDEANAKLKTAQEANTAAEKALADAKTAKQKADEEKQKAQQAIPQTENKVREAMQKAKQATETAGKAEGEVQTAQSSVMSAVKAIETAQAASKRAADAVPVAKTAVDTADAKVKGTETDSKPQRKQPRNLRSRRAVAFSPDGLLAVGGDDGALHLYGGDLAAGFDVIAGHAAPIALVAFTANGNLLATAADKTTALWSAQAGWTLERTIGGVDDSQTLVDRVAAISFSPDGKFLATGSGQPSRTGQLKIWNVADGAVCARFANRTATRSLGSTSRPTASISRRRRRIGS